MRVKYILNGELSGWRRTMKRLRCMFRIPLLQLKRNVLKDLFFHLRYGKGGFNMQKYFVTQTQSFWKKSANEFKHVSSICIASMMTALNTLIGAFRIVVIPKFLTISFASLATASCAIMCGPLLTGTVAAIADILEFMLRPDGSFFFGFTLNEFLTGLIYGAFFYRTTTISLKRCILARLCIVLLMNMFLTPLWLYILYGDSFFVLLTTRVIKNIIMFPIDVALLYFVTTTTLRILKQMQR